MDLEEVIVRRVTRESTVEVDLALRMGESKPCTGYVFLDHMIETMGRWGCFTIRLDVEAGRRLSHMIAEDSGIALGSALKELSRKRIEDLGINCVGFAYAVLDEALSQAVVSIEGRANAFIDATCEGGRTERVEDSSKEDLKAFIEGLAQGWSSTIHVRILNGRDPHHSWESAFRALGIAISNSLMENPSRKGEIAGLKSYFGA
ncbi:MAG: imidazoleglycerol-phosphate dehydratase [Candidatus Bathyarchaeia archaeon]